MFVKTHEDVSLIYPDVEQFKNARTIFAIDLIRQPEIISESKHNIVLHVEFNDAVPANNNVIFA